MDKSLLSPEYVADLCRKGWSLQKIADLHGVSRQYIYQLRQQTGYESPITKVGKNLPWTVDPTSNESNIYRSLRLYGHYRLEGLDSLSVTTHRKLRVFLSKIYDFDLVVDYDPKYPAIPGLSSTPGFAYLQREEQDENYVIKIRDGVRLTPLGMKLWSLPENPEEILGA